MNCSYCKGKHYNFDCPSENAKEAGIEIKSARNKQIEEIFKFLENVDIKKTEIQDFVDSLHEFYLTKKFLTDKQFQALCNVYDKL
jgi:hypothetical protein